MAPAKYLLLIFKLLSAASDVNVCVYFIICMWPVCGYLTLSEAWRVVIHIRQGDVDHGGPSQPPSLPGHVFGFDHHLVMFSLFSVHVTRTQSCPDNACQKTDNVIVLSVALFQTNHVLEMMFMIDDVMIL